MRKPGAKQRIRQFFLENIGRVVNSAEIKDAAGSNVSEWARRVRELREDEHWLILTHNDDWTQARPIPPKGETTG